MTLTPFPVPSSDLSTHHPEKFPATELIHSLLEEVEVVISSSGHGLRILYKLIERARDLYSKINQRISRVEKTNSWDEYDAYTRAIDPLEQVLLEAIPAILDNQVYLITPVSSEDLIEFTDKWFINERIICKCFRRLGTEAEFQELAPLSRDIEDEILEANAHDRRDFFDGLLLEIMDKAMRCTPPNLQVLLNYVTRGLQSAWNTYSSDPLKSANEEWGIASVKSAILTRSILVYVTQVPSVPNIPDDFCWGGAIWKRLLGMVTLINMALSSQPIIGTTLGPAKDYQSAVDSNPGKMDSLPKKPPHSRRPYLKPIHIPSEPVLPLSAEPHDPPWVLFERLQEPFLDPHTPTHTQRISQYRTYSPKSPSPVFSVQTPINIVAARTPASQWLPGLRFALAFRNSASLPHAHSVCGKLPLYRFLGFGFRVNS